MGLSEFLVESNRIEGIINDSPGNARALEFLDQEDITTASLALLVVDIGGGPLRDRPGMNVRVGSHRPQAGGEEIGAELDGLLRVVSDNRVHPYDAHVIYETLHPFMDGNGRSGRLLWAWQMRRFHGYRFERTFLHEWYYQTLEHAAERAARLFREVFGDG